VPSLGESGRKISSWKFQKASPLDDAHSRHKGGCPLQGCWIAGYQGADSPLGTLQSGGKHKKNPQFTSTYFSYDAGEDTVLGQRAMREPTQEMLDAWIRAPGAKEGWQAMIDCALRETGNEPVAKG
jgi:hypothetical protein